MSELQYKHGIRAIVSVRPLNRRLLLIEVAELLFATSGFSETTVETIARNASVPAHVVYNLFGSKARLLEQVEAARADRLSC